MFKEYLSVALAFVQLNGSSIAGGFSDNTVRIWSDFSSISSRQILFGHQDMVASINVLNDGRVASGSCDNSIIIWKKVDSKWIKNQTLKEHSDCVNGLISSIDSYLISGSKDKSLIIWNENPSTGFSISKILNFPDSILALSYLKANSLLAIGLSDSTISLYNISNINQPQSITLLQGHSDSVLTLTFASFLNKPVLASGSKDKLIIIWDLNQLAIKEILQGHLSDVTSLILLSNGFLASGSADNSIRIWDTNLYPQYTLFSHYSSLTSLLSINSTMMISASLDTQLVVWKIKTDLTLKYTMNHTNSVQDVIQLPNDQVATGSDDYSAHIWSRWIINSTVLSSHLDYVYALEYLVDGSIATVSKDVSVRIWNYSTLTLTNILYSHEGPIMSILSINNSIEYSTNVFFNFVTGSCDNSIKFWDNRYRLIDTKVNAHDDCINALVLYDNRYLLSGGNDSVIKIWSLGSYIIHQNTLYGHTQQVNGLAILQNSNLASASSDRTIKIWQDVYQNLSLNLTFTCLTVINNNLFASYLNDLTKFDWYYNQTNKFVLQYSVTALSSLANGYLVAGFSNGNISIYTDNTFLNAINMTGHNNELIAFASSNNHLVSVSQDIILIWETNSLLNGKIVPYQQIKNFGNFQSLIFFKNIIGNSFLAISNDNSITIFNGTFSQINKIQTTSPVKSMTSLKNDKLAAGCENGSIIIYNENSFGFIIELKNHTASVTSLETQSVTGNLISSSLDGYIFIWDIINYVIISVLKETFGIKKLQMINQIPIAILSEDSKLTILEKTGNFQNTLNLTGHYDAVLDLAVLQNGFLASGSRDTTIKIWDNNLLNIVNVTNNSFGHTRSVLALRALSNGDLASTSEDRTAKVWYTNLFYNISTFA
jgi:WD40 repeat protein